MVKLLHTEASTGWGGQEIRILREAEGMRQRGHTVSFAVVHGAQLGIRAQKAGFPVAEMPLEIRKAPLALYQLQRWIRKQQVDIVNTHSSADGWLGGVAARLTGRKVIRTRHLSTPIKPGLNSRLLYNWLADFTATTCQEVAEIIVNQAKIDSTRCKSIPTGVDPAKMSVEEKEREAFREKWGLKPTDCVLGSVCVLRSWKGIMTLLQAAKQLEHVPHLKWVVVGGGSAEHYFKQEWERLGLHKQVIFTGHLDNPLPALAALDVFLLLSTAHEGISQASLQAAYFKKPLITTRTGGLREVCLHDKTGFLVDPHNAEQVANWAKHLGEQPAVRQQLGQHAHELVLEKYTFDRTLDDMEAIYRQLGF